MAWLPGFKKRIKWTIDHDDIDANVTWFPVRLHLGTVVGIEGTEEQTSSSSNYFLYSGSKTRCGQKLTISGKTVTKLSFLLYRYGNPSGNVTFTVRQTDDTVLASKIWGDSGGLSTPAPTWKEVTLDTPINVNEEVRVSCEYSGGDSSNFVGIRYKNTDVKASEGLSYYDGSWTDEDGNGNDYDCAYKYTYAHDISCIFDELGAEDLKIAITKADGLTELYGEIEKWDDTNEEAELWVSRDGWAISDSADTDGYLYYDSTHADNDTYIGVKNSTPAQSVWDGNFKGVWHMVDGASTSAIYDSTSNNNDGAKKGANEPIEAAGKIHKCQSFDNTDDYILVSDSAELRITGDLTVEAWLKTGGVGHGDHIYHAYYNSSPYTGFAVALNGAGAGGNDGKVSFYSSGGGGWLLGDSTYNDDSWHYIATALDSTTIRFYGDGATDGTGASAVPGAWTGNRGIGAKYVGTNQIDGEIDELRLSDVARSASWIKASYESERDHLITWGSEEVNFETGSEYQLINLGVQVYG